MTTHDSPFAPCPFDGSTNITIKTRIQRRGTLPHVTAYCAQCGAGGPIARSVADAVAVWNTRKAPER